MTHRLFTAAAAAVALISGANAAQAQDFRALAQQDLRAIHDMLRDNHPAAVVPGEVSAGYRSWLETGLTDAQSRLK